MLHTIRCLLLLLRLITILSVAAISAIGQDAAPAGSFPSSFPSVAQQRRPDDLPDPATIKLGTELVSLRVTVTDRSGRTIEGLKKESFKIYEDKVEQPVSFFSDEDTPVSVAIVFDTSGSMSGSKIVHAKEALARFIQTSHEQDEYFLISFGSRPQLLLDGVRDGQAVLDQFSNVRPEGHTALYDAVSLGIEKVSRGTCPKRAIMLISDGEDNHSRSSFDQVRRRLQESDIAIYTIEIGGSSPSPKSRAIGGIIMDKLAAISGGKSFWPGNAEKMDAAFEQIALELRRQYSVGYLPSNFAPDGKWHRIKVTVTAPDESPRLVVRSREGYYAVKNQDDHRGRTGTRN